jgi:hypothetical protein
MESTPQGGSLMTEPSSNVQNTQNPSSIPPATEQVQPAGVKPGTPPPEQAFSLEPSLDPKYNRFDGSVTDLKAKYPKWYQQFEEQFIQNTYHVVKKSSERMIEKMKEARREQ